MFPESVSGLWESPKPVVVVGRGGRIEEQVNQAACAADKVEILRRSSGGGAVVLAPGCLNFTLHFSLDTHPHLHNIARSYLEILAPLAAALGAEIQGQSDLVYQGRKVSGNAQHRTSTTVLHHGTLLIASIPNSQPATCSSRSASLRTAASARTPNSSATSPTRQRKSGSGYLVYIHK